MAGDGPALRRGLLGARRAALVDAGDRGARPRGAALSSDRAAFEAWQAVLAPFAISEDPAEDALRHREIAKELATARVPLAMLVALTAACGRMAAVFYCDAAASARR